MSARRGSLAFAVAVGSCDTATGLALIAAPLSTLKLMGIAIVPTEPVFVRWIGAFVLAVGLSYFYPFALRDGGAVRFGERLAAVFEVTSLARTLVALVAGGAIAAGLLERAWFGVPLFDAAVAASQVVLLRRGGLRHD